MSAVPNLIGLTPAQAQTVLADNGFLLGTTSYSSEYVSVAPIGTIQSQSPIAGFVATGGYTADGTWTADSGVTADSGLANIPVDITVSQLVAEFNIDQTVIAQYANSNNVDAIVENLAQYFDPTTNLDQFYTMVWNMFTAVGFGLDIWGRILGVSRFLVLPENGTYFGWVNDGDLDYTGFGQAPFYNGAEDTTTFRLSDAAFLTLLIAKAFANICRTSITSLNQLLMILFGASGVVWVQDNQNMTMTVVFKFIPSDVQLAIVTQSGVFPHPTGVNVATSIP